MCWDYIFDENVIYYYVYDMLKTFGDVTHTLYRTKLKQTEVDCEYLKRCCETLTEENKRLQKEVQELRALKSSKPFYMQLPATTLTMCPSCERVASSTATTANVAAVSAPAATVVTTKQPRLHPFLQDQVLTLQASS